MAILWNHLVFPVCDPSAYRGSGACDWSATRGNGIQAFSLSFAAWHNGCLYRSGLDSLQTGGRADAEAFEENPVCLGGDEQAESGNFEKLKAKGEKLK